MKKQISALALLLLVSGSAMAQTFTVATFSDPTIGQSPAASSMFTFNTATSQLTGSWINGTSVGNLTVQVGNTTFANSSLTMSAVAATAIPSTSGLFTLGAGSATFSNAANPSYLTISWTSGFFAQGFGFGSTAAGVNFTGSSLPAGAAGWSSRAFNFSFANTQTSGNNQTSTASLTSSAVPEPFTMAALALGIGAIAARRRRKS